MNARWRGNEAWRTFWSWVLCSKDGSIQIYPNVFHLSETSKFERLSVSNLASPSLAARLSTSLQLNFCGFPHTFEGNPWQFFYNESVWNALRDISTALSSHFWLAGNTWTHGLFFECKHISLGKPSNLHELANICSRCSYVNVIHTGWNEWHVQDCKPHGFLGALLKDLLCRAACEGGSWAVTSLLAVWALSTSPQLHLWDQM